VLYAEDIIMSYQSLAATTANITELRRNPMGTIKEGKGDAVAILYRNEPAFYLCRLSSTPTIWNWPKMPS
jgi:antitoxin StbD